MNVPRKQMRLAISLNSDLLFQKQEKRNKMKKKRQQQQQRQQQTNERMVERNEITESIAPFEYQNEYICTCAIHTDARPAQRTFIRNADCLYTTENARSP